jgi:hypothetical protein
LTVFVLPLPLEPGREVDSAGVKNKEVDMATAQASKICDLNDAFRRSGFGVMMTVGVRGLEDLNGLMRAVRMFDKFTEDNDPHGEHDFGSIIWHDETVLWKIDYYDHALRGWEDPVSRDCRRILTVMLVSEY